MYYLDRVMKDVMSACPFLLLYSLLKDRYRIAVTDGGGPVETEMFARHPDDPVPSKDPHLRKIRCKMCRYVRFSV